MNALVRWWFAVMGVDLDRVLDYINSPASYGGDPEPASQEVL